MLYKNIKRQNRLIVISENHSMPIYNIYSTVEQLIFQSL
jgi:hypothetical protein